MSARPRAVGSSPPGPLASTRDSTATAWTRCWTSARERTLTKAADAHALVAARSQVLADGREVEVAGVAEVPQVPAVLTSLGLGVAVGEADPVEDEAGEAGRVGVALRVEGLEVEVQHRGHAGLADTGAPGGGGMSGVVVVRGATVPDLPLPLDLPPTGDDWWWR